VLRSFYRAIVAMGHLEPSGNPMSGFPSIKAVPRKLPVSLAAEQVSRLLVQPKTDTVIGLRDRAVLAILYGTGIRATECATLRCGQVDLVRLSITVHGKGGHERAIPLNAQLAEVLRTYAHARGPALPTAPFFRSRFGRPLSRGAIYERVRTWGQRSRVGIPLSPHRLRHTFATHLVRAGVGLSRSVTCSDTARSAVRRSTCMSRPRTCATLRLATRSASYSPRSSTCCHRHGCRSSEPEPGMPADRSSRAFELNSVPSSDRDALGRRITVSGMV
jgi:integrase